MKKTLENFITLPYKLERAAPPFESNDIKTPESLPRYFIKALSKPGAKIFDPFAGLGTTMFVAEELKRIPYGIEADPLRQQWVAGQLENWTHVICADSIKAAKLGFPKMDMLMTAPPFMAINHKWNPLYAGDPARQGYDVYLKRMQAIFKQASSLMKKGAPVVVQVDNIPGRTFTPLIRDLGTALAKVMILENEITIAFDGARADYRHTHCLIFKTA